ncbi:MAG: hypothetical protein KKF22_00860 [Gammaproteobacteria bacterium]|nr:hypothetical protein [Gammaproteobacteria bacterium]
MRTATKQKSQAATSAAGALMSQEQFWLANLDEAQQCWNQLSREQLLQSQGMPHRLCRLLQEHYDLSRQQADYQISRFKESCQLSPVSSAQTIGHDIS